MFFWSKFTLAKKIEEIRVERIVTNASPLVSNMYESPFFSTLNVLKIFMATTLLRYRIIENVFSDQMTSISQREIFYLLFKRIFPIFKTICYKNKLFFKTLG